VIACILTIQFAGAAVASSVTLAWNPNSELYLAGYNVYRSNQPGSFPSTPLNGTLLTMTSFTDSTAANGTYYYVVRAVSVGGQESASSNQVQVTLNASQPVNSRPAVSAGPNRTITLPASTTLTATATDDGLPSALTYAWSVVSGTGVNFASPNSSSTQVSFSAAGTYTLRVTVSDGQLSSTADVVITVNAGNADVEHGQIQSGYLVVTPDWESAAPAPTVTFGLMNGGTVQAHAGMVPGLTTTDASFFVEIMADIGRTVGVAIVNPGSSTNTVTLTLRDTNGTIAGSPVTLSLQPYQQAAQLVHDLFPSDATGTEFHGSLRLQSSTPFAALGLRFSGGEFSALPFTSATSVPSAASRTFVDGSTASTPLAGTVGGPTALILPEFAMSGGWATQIALVSNNGTTITGRVDILDNTGNPMAVNLNGAVQSTFSYSILANGTFVLAPRDANGRSPF
jgi:K319-like protein